MPEDLLEMLKLCVKELVKAEAGLKQQDVIVVDKELKVEYWHWILSLLV